MSETDLAASVKNEELLDISIERVEKINSPLLVIGLGGTGADVVRTVKRTFADRYVLPRNQHGNPIPVPVRTAYLVIETDNNSHEGFEDSQFVDISLPGIETILDPGKRDFNLADYERKWVNKNLSSASHGLGSGTYRQASRFMLSRNYSKVYQAIRGALQNIVTVNAGASDAGGRTEIIIAAGICGGTGSGTFLDVAQIIRHCMASEPNLAGLKYKITGYIVMPDVSLAKGEISGNPALLSLLKQNGFAALKELDFWMRVNEHKTPYSMQYSGSPAMSWMMPPFDSCILMSAIGVKGQAYADGYRVIQKTIAENLLHYLAHEQTEKKADGTVEYTYISYEDNLKATVTAMEKRLPVYYGYRAIGAYTKKIPKKKLLYYEGNLLFDTFIPQRDAQGRLVPNASLLHDGKSGNRVRTITGDIGAMYTNFRGDVKLPSFCNVQTTEKDQMDKLRARQPRPHECADSKPNPWKSTVIQPAAMNAAENFLKTAWQRFIDFAAHVISDPQLGPFSLREYLTDKDKGLVPALNEELNAWKTNSGNFENNIGKRYEDCGNTWKNFVKPPLLGGKKAEASYLKALNDYYDSVRKSEFMKSNEKSLNKLVKRINDYLEHSLKPLCDDLESLQTEFNKAGNAEDSRIQSDIFTLDTIKNRIDTDFKTGNINNKVTTDFLNKLCDESFAAAQNVDQHGTGVTFTYRMNGKNNTLESMRQSLDDCFGAINGQSLDSIMEQTVGKDLAQQQKYMDDLGNSVIQSAQPLFAQNHAYAAEPRSEFNYLSVPDNAQAHIARYKESLMGQNTTPKGSSLRDHMYCTTAWDGLPLYRYNLMTELESVYTANLSNPSVSMGVHLVWDGDLESEYPTNWTRLSSPCPYYFFKSKGNAFSQKLYDEIRSLTDRARVCGMLEVDAAMPIPVYRLRLFYTDAQRKNVRAAETMIQDVKEITAEIDSATGEKIAPEVLKARLEKYLAGSTLETLAFDKKPGVMAPALGLQNEPCDPWDESISANPASMQLAQKNHVRLSEETAAALVAANPRIALSLKNQVEGFEYARKILNGIQVKTKKWEPRVDYAPLVAQMLEHSLITLSIDGWKYQAETGEKQPIIQQALLAEDLRKETGLAQAAAYLGDLTADNFVRRELENQLSNKKDDLRVRADEGKLTQEDIAALLDSISKANMLLLRELNVHKTNQKKMDSDKHKEEYMILMLTDMVTVLDNEKTKLNDMLDMM